MIRPWGVSLAVIGAARLGALCKARVLLSLSVSAALHHDFFGVCIVQKSATDFDPSPLFCLLNEYYCHDNYRDDKRHNSDGGQG